MDIEDEDEDNEDINYTSSNKSSSNNCIENSGNSLDNFSFTQS